MEYFPLLELLGDIQALVVERVACNSFQDLYGLKASSRSMKALTEGRRVYHVLDVLSVLWGLNMSSELLKTCYAERNPSTLYIKCVEFLFTHGLKEERLSLMKRAADAGYERAVYTHAMTRAIFWCDGQYFAGILRESVDRIGKLVRSVKWGWDLWHCEEFRESRALFFRRSTVANVEILWSDNVSACGT
ncbi:hypothetical protein Bca52824_027826 [Brassica carinata]|uniref:Uncharacterized protein n=1 Tax=Brassica carinata TaxID=52824 RepID=A0A8X8ANV3_BRACI|nr:hypothetical protein Bca52824_027826 [Brassica carinata]